MTVTEVVDGLGGWTVNLVEETPDAVLDALAWFGHIVIVPGRLDPVAYGDALLKPARYVGVMRARTRDRRGLAGEGMLYWLGDEDEKGDVLETAVTFTNATITTVVNTLLPVATTVGTIYPLGNPSARYTGTHNLQTRRKALGIALASFGVEFRVNGDASVDVGTQAQLYRSVPEAVISRVASGTDMDLVGVVGDPDVTEQVRDYSNRVVLLGQTDTGGQFAVGSATAPTTPYLDIRGNTIKSTRLISESAETTGSVAARSQLHLNRFNRIVRAVTLTAQEYASEGAIEVGDMAWVYDPESGITNPNNDMTFRGQRIWPDVIRISGYTWPVTRGHTVAFRAPSGVWTDLTPFVTWETGGGEVVVGDLPASLRRPTEDPIAIRADVVRVTAPDATIPNAPTGLTLTTTSGLDAQGRTVPIINVSWTAPTTNTDSTTITDLDHYIVQWRPQFRAPQWSESIATDVSRDLVASPEIPYDVRVCTVDTSGHRSAFTATATITSADDSTVPNTPAAPTVSSYYGQLRIETLGTDTLGNPMPTDANRIEVHVGTTAGFTASAATLISSVPPFGRQLAYATAPYGATRYVRLIAYDHAGNASPPSATVSGATVQVADGDISGLNVGKLQAGTVTADIVMGGRFATALTGARREMNSVGFQAWDASNNLTVSIDGVTNLLTGRYKTALSGRRLEMGSAGLLGDINFFAPDGTQATFRAFTESTGLEAIQFGLVVPGENSLWNRINYNTDGWSNYRANRHDFYVASGTGFFVVRQTTDQGATVAGTLFYLEVNDSYVASANSFQVLSNTIYLNADATVEVDVGVNSALLSIRQGATGVTNHGAHLVQFTPSISGSRYGGGLMMIQDSPGVNTRLGALWFDRTFYMTLVASAFTVSSSEIVKDNVRPFQGSALDILAGAKPTRYRRRRPRAARSEILTGPDGKTREVLHADGPQLPDGPDEIGFIAEQAPAEILSEAGDGIDLYALATLNTTAINELAARLTAIEEARRP